MRVIHVVYIALLLIISSLSYTYAGAVRFKWHSSSSEPPQGYILERKAGLSGVYSEVARFTGLEGFDDKVPKSTYTPVCWQLKAYNELGVSMTSNEICLNLPDAPISFSVETAGPSTNAPRLSVRSQVKVKK